MINIDNKKNKYGQYFTPIEIADFMINLTNLPNDINILEPSCGKGVFLNLLINKGFKKITAYEIDKSLSSKYDFVNYESFISANINQSFDLVIGNPPYIRWANLEDELKSELLSNQLWNKYFNSLCDYLYIFILKSIELLNDNGELIFICPEYWLNTTHSISLRNYMVNNGYFDEIYHFNETPIFDKVTVSTIIFKYIKSKKRKEYIDVVKYYAQQKLTTDILNKFKNKEQTALTEYLTVPQFKINERWILATDKLKIELSEFEKKCNNLKKQNDLLLFEQVQKNKFHTISEFCEIGNGLVSGLDKAFQLNGHLLNECEKEKIIKVIKAKDLEPFFYNNITKYFLLNDINEEEDIKANYTNFYSILKPYKNNLEKRYQYNKKINYWEWVFLRNFNLFSKLEKRIFVPCKERISNKNHFRFALVDENIFPTQDVTAIFKKPTTKESLEYILSYLNNYRVFEWLRYNGIIKGNIVEFSEKPLASIPFRAIDWSNDTEIKIHDSITLNCKKYISERNSEHLKIINENIDQLFI